VHGRNGGRPGLTRRHYRYVSPLLLFSAVMVIVLGGLTIWLHDGAFIKVKRRSTGMVAALLTFGLATSRPLLKMV
jgi:intracellular septation protein